MDGGNHFGIPYDSSYSQMGREWVYRSEDNTMDVLQQFREFKPCLKKRLEQIRQTGRTLELQDEVEDINFYLAVMKDMLADESHGVDQLRSYIDKIHEMIRKNPLTDVPSDKKRTLDGNDDDFADNDKPRSPSPEPRGSDTAANISSTPTHGAQRTEEINLSKNEREEEFDEWGRPISFESTFTRREPYKGDMRGGYFQGSSGSGGRGRRWSEESDFSGARAAGRGMSMGRGAPMPPHHRHYQDIGRGRGRGYDYDSNDFDCRNEFYMDRPREPSKESGSDWFGGGPPNGNKFDDRQSDPSFRGGSDRRSREDERRMNHSDDRDREEKFHHAQHIAKYFERRSSSEGRGEDRQDDYISMCDGMNNAHQDYNHARRGPHGHSDFHGRGRPEDGRHDPRSRMDAGSSYTPSIPHPPQPSPMGYGVPPPSPHYTNAGLLPMPSPFPNTNPPLLLIPVPNAPSVVGMGHVLPNMGPAIPPIAPPPMAFHRPRPPMSNYPVSEILPNFHYLSRPPHGSPPSHAATSHPPPQSPHSHMPQRGLTRPPVPSPVRTTPQHTPQDKHRARPAVNHTVENRQHSPPALRSDPRCAKQTSRSDAGNVLRPSSSDPRARSRIDQYRQRQQSTKDRMKQHKFSKSYSNSKGSKIQQLRKQFEKEGFPRLWKPSKKNVSFEDDLNTQANAKKKPAKGKSTTVSSSANPPPHGSPPSHAATSHPQPQSPHSYMPQRGLSRPTVPSPVRTTSQPTLRDKHRARPTVNRTVQNRHDSPPAPRCDPPRAKQTSRSDTGNVLRLSSSDPRARSRIDQVRKRQQDTKDRMKQHESSKSSRNNKGSKIQELRKQFEKEGFHTRWKPSWNVSFEDALKAQAIYKKKPAKGKSTAEPIPISSIDVVIPEVASRAEVAVFFPASIEPPTSTSTTKDATTEEEFPISEPSNTSTPTTNTPNIPEEIEKSAEPSTFVSLQMPGTSDQSSDVQVSVQGSKKKKSTPVIDVDDESSLESTTSANGQEDVRVKMEIDDASIHRDDSSIKKLVFSTKCEKCNFSGKKIVAHYVNKHYPCQIPQARLMPATFNGLIGLNTSESPQLIQIVMDENNAPIWPCLYCNLRFHKIVDFYDHLTSHTGEFRFECAECLMSYPEQKSLTTHLKSHKGATRASVKLTYPSDIHASARELTGYLCNDCFYFQLRFENITRHFDQSGHSSLDVKSLRLIRPPLPETVDKKPHISQTGIEKEPEAQTEVTPNPPKT